MGRKIILATVVVIPVLVVAGVVVALPRLNLAGPVARRATATLGRTVAIESVRVSPGRILDVEIRGVGSTTSKVAVSDRHFPGTSKIVLVQDNLSTHKPASLPWPRWLVKRFHGTTHITGTPSRLGDSALPWSDMSGFVQSM